MAEVLLRVLRSAESAPTSVNDGVRKRKVFIALQMSHLMDSIVREIDCRLSDKSVKDTLLIVMHRNREAVAALVLAVAAECPSMT